MKLLKVSLELRLLEVQGRLTWYPIEPDFKQNFL
jgi:hypothetical protein